MKFESKWTFGDRVLIDGDSSIKGTVTALLFRPSHYLVEVSWFHNGEAKCAFVEEFRLSRSE